MIAKILNVLGWIIWAAWIGLCVFMTYIFLKEHAVTAVLVYFGSAMVSTVYLSSLLIMTFRKRAGLRLWIVPPVTLLLRKLSLHCIYPAALSAGLSDVKAWAGIILLEFFLLNSFALMLCLIPRRA